MTAMQPLLIELGTEELPVKAPARPGAGLVRRRARGAGEARHRGRARRREAAVSPRRLAVLLPGVAVEQPNRPRSARPLPQHRARCRRQPTKALEGFAAKAGVEWTRLDKLTDAKGRALRASRDQIRRRTRDLLPEVLREAIAAMPIPKPMRWGDHDYAFARPVHWLVLLLGEDVVETESFGMRADRMSRGHRFLHDKPVWIGTRATTSTPCAAPTCWSTPTNAARASNAEVHAAAKAAGGTARIDADNLEQVNCLNEWPAAVACAFEREFLAVPQEALVATMETNQKFFPVLDAGGRLTEHFIGIANIEPKDPSEIRKGYERVIRPRFADAKFFFDEDLKRGLAAMARASRTSPTRPNSAGRRQRPNAWPRWPRRSRRQADVDPQLARRAAAAGEERPAKPHGQRVPGTAGHRRPLLRQVRGRSGRGRLAIDEAYQPRFAGDDIALSRSARCSRSPNGWTRLRAGSPPASNRPATRIRSRCGAMRARFGADDYREGYDRLAGSFVRSLYADPTATEGMSMQRPVDRLRLDADGMTRNLHH